jgi:hypothetical protein
MRVLSDVDYCVTNRGSGAANRKGYGGNNIALLPLTVLNKKRIAFSCGWWRRAR